MMCITKTYGMLHALGFQKLHGTVPTKRKKISETSQQLVSVTLFFEPPRELFADCVGSRNHPGSLRPIQATLEDVPDSDVLALIGECLKFDEKKRLTFKEITRRLNEALERCQKEESGEEMETKKNNH
jgi:hypothetical protein